MRYSMIIALCFTLHHALLVSAAEQDYLDAFPDAASGQARFVLRLPHKDRSEEQDFRVEIFVGRMQETDGVNRFWMMADIQKKPLKGWGFEYYQLEAFGPVASTRMGVPPGTKKKREFVHGKPLMLSYNSRVPLVVYAPKGAEVRYRIWTAGPAKPLSAD